MLLKDKTAIIYGGGGAVGGAVARAFAREGAYIFLAGRTAEKLETVAAEIHANRGKAEVARVNALDRDTVEAHLAAITDKAGPVRLMFNAIDWGDTQGQALVDMTHERFSTAVATALQTWFVTGTCAAVEHFLRQLAVEMGPSNVRVCFVRSAGSPDAPGVKEAFKLRAAETGLSLDEVLRQAGSSSPLRHLPWLAEVADAAVLLASDYARGMTATLANVTCGAQVD